MSLKCSWGLNVKKAYNTNIRAKVYYGRPLNRISYSEMQSLMIAEKCSL